MLAFPVFIVHVETEYTPTANFNGNAFCQQRPMNQEVLAEISLLDWNAADGLLCAVYLRFTFREWVSHLGGCPCLLIASAYHLTGHDSETIKDTFHDSLDAVWRQAKISHIILLGKGLNAYVGRFSASEIGLSDRRRFVSYYKLAENNMWFHLFVKFTSSEDASCLVSPIDFVGRQLPRIFSSSYSGFRNYALSLVCHSSLFVKAPNQSGYNIQGRWKRPRRGLEALESYSLPELKVGIDKRWVTLENQEILPRWTLHINIQPVVGATRHRQFRNSGTINPICLKVADETNLVTRVSGHISADSTILTDMKLSGPQQMHTLCKEFLDDEFQHVLRGDSPYRTTELLSCNQDDGSFVYQMAYSCTDDQESCEKPIKDILQELTEVVEDGEQSFNKVCQVWPKDIDELVVYLTVSKEETTVGYDAVES
ncbi:hypothetical protein CLF_108619, partial [Clonorchis sinensis]